MGIDIGALIVVAQQHGAPAERCTGGLDANLGFFVGQRIKLVKMNDLRSHLL
jgi:hypothetical protein